MSCAHVHVCREALIKLARPHALHQAAAFGLIPGWIGFHLGRFISKWYGDAKSSFVSDSVKISSPPRCSSRVGSSVDRGPNRPIKASGIRPGSRASQPAPSRLPIALFRLLAAAVRCEISGGNMETHLNRPASFFQSPQRLLSDGHSSHPVRHNFERFIGYFRNLEIIPARREETTGPSGTKKVSTSDLNESREFQMA